MLTYLRASPATYPATRPIRVTEPTFAQEAITLAEARDQVGLTGNESHDPWLTTHISTARAEVEHDTGVACYTGSFLLNLTYFPCENFISIYGAFPVTAIDSITYVDTSGTTQAWSNTFWQFNAGALVPLIQLRYAQVWPVVRGDIEGVTITFTAGYSSVAAIPAKVKAAVRLKLHELWQLKMGEDAEKTVKGYERLVNLIRRDDYA